MEPRRNTNRPNDPFCPIQVARGGRIHPVPSHANMPDDRAAEIETMCGYLRGANCSRKLVVTVRVLVCVRGPVIDLQTTRGPVIITPVPSGRGHAWDGLDADQVPNAPIHKHTRTHADTCSHIQTHSRLCELHAGQCPTVIKTRLLWRQRHHANTHTRSVTHARTPLLRGETVFFLCVVCLFIWYTDLSGKSARCS